MIPARTAPQPPQRFRRGRQALNADPAGDFGAACADAEAWPLPGGGSTGRRFRLLAAQCRYDLVLGRLVEAHADALAILAELTGEPPEPSGGRHRWGVWAAGPPGSLEATPTRDRWLVRGQKRWCSGATLLTNALTDAATHGGQQLFAVELSHPGVRVLDPDWVGSGMSRAETRTVEFRDVPAQAIGAPGGYVDRPGFWMGAIGVAACWHGGTVAVAETLRQATVRQADPHRLAHLAAVHVAIEQNRALLESAAKQLDAEPEPDHAVLARTVRAAVERNAVRVVDHVGRALGPAPLAHDARHSSLVADLQVYVRQHHAERDLELLGIDLVAEASSWIW